MTRATSLAGMFCRKNQSSGTPSYRALCDRMGIFRSQEKRPTSNRSLKQRDNIEPAAMGLLLESAPNACFRPQDHYLYAV